MSVIIRVYILEFKNIMSKDDDSLSDPYLKIMCNNKVYNVYFYKNFNLKERDEHIDDSEVLEKY